LPPKLSRNLTGTSSSTETGSSTAGRYSNRTVDQRRRATRPNPNRAGNFYPSLLERRRSIDQSLYAVIMEAYVHGIPTRSVDDLVKALGADTGISKSEVSRICAELDTQLTAFSHPAAGPRPLPVHVCTWTRPTARQGSPHVGRRPLSRLRCCWQRNCELPALRIAGIPRWRRAVGRRKDSRESEPRWALTFSMRTCGAGGADPDIRPEPGQAEPGYVDDCRLGCCTALPYCLRERCNALGSRTGFPRSRRNP
jgi:hypothetical protein